MTLVDIQAVSSIAHARGSLVVVDNTFLLRKVIALLPESFDAWSKHFLHSVAKYINGHSVGASGLTFVENYLLSYLECLDGRGCLELLRNSQKATIHSKRCQGRSESL